MARYHVIEGGKVVNSIEAEGPDVLPGLTLVLPKGGSDIGWTWDGQNYSPPAPVPPSPPDETHAAWLRAALAEAGKLDAVDAAVEAAGPVKLALWQYATTIRRDDPDVMAIAGALKIDLAALFLRADAIRRERTGV